jgi:hypothetical protein
MENAFERGKRTRGARWKLLRFASVCVAVFFTGSASWSGLRSTTPVPFAGKVYTLKDDVRMMYLPVGCYKLDVAINNLILTHTL